MSGSTDVYQFGDYLIHTESNLVEKDGKRSSVSPKVMDVLAYLIEHRDRIVSADELLEKFWAGRVVEESTVHRLISQIRTALGDTARDSAYIRTVSKRGYQAVAEVGLVSPSGVTEELAPAEAAKTTPAARQSPDTEISDDLLDGTIDLSAGRARHLLPISILILAFAVVFAALTQFLSDEDEPAGQNLGEPRESIAVLPFVNLSAEDQVGYFATGLADNILDELAVFEHMKIASRTTTFKLALDDLDLKSIAEQLNVDYVMEGSIQEFAGELRITAQLIRASDDFHVFSKTYRRALGDGFDMQSEVAAQIAQLAKDAIWMDLRRLYTQRYRGLAGVNRQAVNLYLRSIEQYNLWLLGEGGDLLLAEELVERAAEVDPNFILAHAEIAWNNHQRIVPGRSVAEASQRAHEAIDKIMVLRPDSFDANFMLVQTYIQLDLNYAAAEVLYNRIIAKWPKAIWWRGFMANVAIREGRLEDGMQLLETEAVIGAGVNDTELWPFYITSLQFSGRHQKSLDTAEKLLNLVHSGTQRAKLLRLKAESLRALGRTLEAETVLEEAWRLGRHDVPAEFAETFAKFGDLERAKTALVTAKITSLNRGDFIRGYHALGDLDTLFMLMKTGIEDHDRSVIDTMRLPYWSDAILNDPRFAENLELLESKETHSSKFVPLTPAQLKSY